MITALLKRLGQLSYLNDKFARAGPYETKLLEHLIR